jgi:class 3 adenylate cyclase
MLPVGRLEADLVLAEIALGRGDRDAPALVAAAVAQATSGGWLASPTYRRLAPLASGAEPVAEPVATERERRTFMFTDIVGSTNLVEMLGDEAWGHLLRWHDDTLRSLFEAHAGREVNRIGDGFFVAFADPRSAAACAIAIQRALDQHRRTHGFSPGIRIGLHEAEATRSGADYQGRGVHVAARIAALAGGGEILASRDALGALADLATSAPRPVTLKGLSEPIEVVAVDWQ